MIRTFLAVELGDELRNQITLTQQDLKQRLVRESSKDIRITWVQPSSIHLTMKFLGDTDEHLIEPLREAIERAMPGHGAVHMPIERLGVFPRLLQPRVLWIGPSEQWEQSDDAKRLVALHRAVENCCQSVGFAPEGRPLSPHLTLARVKEGERHVGQALAESGAMDRPVSLGLLAVESIVLMKSELRPTGSVYTKLWVVRTGGNRRDD
ncbi:MAG TPA: RNA 2',3'-cyclic phosphodiesterase, partial [Nitrospira sp.]|nr:RNA 2',3'-cyclic phosphodiesterase [Nitrospira sp.]